VKLDCTRSRFRSENFRSVGNSKFPNVWIFILEVAGLIKKGSTRCTDCTPYTCTDLQSKCGGWAYCEPSTKHMCVKTEATVLRARGREFVRELLKRGTAQKCETSRKATCQKNPQGPAQEEKYDCGIVANRDRLGLCRGEPCRLCDYNERRSHVGVRSSTDTREC
jgi:hypothetical protein